MKKTHQQRLKAAHKDYKALVKNPLVPLSLAEVVTVTTKYIGLLQIEVRLNKRKVKLSFNQGFNEGAEYMELRLRREGKLK